MSNTWPLSVSELQHYHFIAGSLPFVSHYIISLLAPYLSCLPTTSFHCWLPTFHVYPLHHFIAGSLPFVSHYIISLLAPYLSCLPTTSFHCWLPTFHVYPLHHFIAGSLPFVSHYIISLLAPYLSCLPTTSFQKLQSRAFKHKFNKDSGATIKTLATAEIT